MVDKDLAAALLAESLEADALLLLTDVPRVLRNFGTPDQTEIATRHPRSCGQDFPAGSMGPKVEAVSRFVELTGDMAAIGALEDGRRSSPARPAPS